MGGGALEGHAGGRASENWFSIAGAGGGNPGANGNPGDFFPPGFSSSGMSAIVLNTLWNIMPPTIKRQVLADYDVYGRKQQRKQAENAMGNKFRELVYAIQDGTFYLYISQNSAAHYTINGTEVGGAKTKYQGFGVTEVNSIFGMGTFIPGTAMSVMNTRPGRLVTMGGSYVSSQVLVLHKYR